MIPFALFIILGLASLCAGWVFPRDLPDGVYHITLPDEHDTESKPIVKRGNTPGHVQSYIQDWYEFDFESETEPIHAKDPIGPPMDTPPVLPVNDPPGDRGVVPLVAEDFGCVYNKPEYEQPDYEIARTNLLSYCNRWGLPGRTSHVSAARRGEVIVYVCNFSKRDNICSAREYLFLEKHYLDWTCGPNTPGWVHVEEYSKMYGRGWIGDDICTIKTGVPEPNVQDIIWAGRPPEWGDRKRPPNHKLVDSHINWLNRANGRTTPSRDFRAEWEFPGVYGMPDHEKAIKEKTPEQWGAPYKERTAEQQKLEQLQAELRRIESLKSEALKAAKEKADKEAAEEEARQEQEDILRAEAMKNAEEARLEKERIEIERKLEWDERNAAEKEKEKAEERKKERAKEKKKEMEEVEEKEKEMEELEEKEMDSVKKEWDEEKKKERRKKLEKEWRKQDKKEAEMMKKKEKEEAEEEKKKKKKAEEMKKKQAEDMKKGMVKRRTRRWRAARS